AGVVEVELLVLHRLRPRRAARAQMVALVLIVEQLVREYGTGDETNATERKCAVAEIAPQVARLGRRRWRLGRIRLLERWLGALRAGGFFIGDVLLHRVDVRCFRRIDEELAIPDQRLLAVLREPV